MPSFARSNGVRSMAHSAIAMNDLAPLRTAQAPRARIEMNLCRTPRLLRGSATALKASNSPCGDMAAMARGVWGGERQRGSAKIHKRTRRRLQGSLRMSRTLDDHRSRRVRVASTPLPACRRATRRQLRLCRGPGPWGAQLAADRHNATTAKRFDRVVTTTRFAAQEFARIGIPTDHVPLGVDLERFRPINRPQTDGVTLLVLCSRLSREKRPDLAIEALRVLHRVGCPARLVVAGSGPLTASLRRRARGLPLEMVGHLSNRSSA